MTKKGAVDYERAEPVATNESVDRAWLIDTTQRLHQFQRAVLGGHLRFHESMTKTVDEVLGIKLLPGQLINTAAMSPEAIALVRTSGMALRFAASQESDVSKGHEPIDRSEGQSELFRHFAEVFAALTGQTYDAFPTQVELAAAVRARAGGERKTVEHAFERACKDLEAFYREHAMTLWAHARELGGLKLVLGGQRLFGESAFAGVRKMALYADTQLIADPIFPFFERDLGLKTQYVDLLTQLYRLLQLSPLVHAKLPVPPVLIFPSFEKVLEDGDVQTQIGINDLVLRTVGGACDVAFSSMDELVQFAGTESKRFVAAVMESQLFVPPGTGPGEIMNPEAAVQRYIAEVGQYRTAEAVDHLARLPLPAVLLTGVLERFAPQFHLLENASELAAQPMLTQQAHWHFFEKAASATATDLHRKDVLSADALKALQALQHARLAWLADVPMSALVELLVNQENLAFRKELSEHTKSLSSSGIDDLDRTVREVCHAIESMVQRHQKSLLEIDAKYAPKYGATWLTGGAGIGLGIGAMFMPMLAAFAPVAPLVTVAAVAGKLAVDKVQKSAEVKRARASLLGVLASTPRR